MLCRSIFLLTGRNRHDDGRNYQQKSFIDRKKLEIEKMKMFSVMDGREGKEG
jgi:hypothetical protein